MDKKNTRQIPLAEPDLTGNEISYVVDAIEREKRVSSGGTYVEKFEQECAAHFDRTYAVSCSNGTTALHLALLALGIGPGDEVIVPAFTFAASASAVLHAGAVPVFIDVTEEKWNIDVSQLDAKRTPRTRAVMAVDIYGLPADYEALETWCAKHQVLLIEDAAEAHGARYRGRPAGSFGETSIFSFYGNKILTTGEGGVVLTNDAAVAEKVRVFKNHGMREAGVYEHEVLGYNYRLTNVQAAIGCAQFERFAEFLAKRRSNEKLYKQLLQHPQIRFQSAAEKIYDPAPWLVSARIAGIPIDKLRAGLQERGIETRPLFKPLHLQKAYLPYVGDGVFPVSEKIWQEGISLPSSSLLSEEDIKYISKTVLNLIS